MPPKCGSPQVWQPPGVSTLNHSDLHLQVGLPLGMAPYWCAHLQMKLPQVFLPSHVPAPSAHAHELSPGPLDGGEARPILPAPNLPPSESRPPHRPAPHFSCACPTHCSQPGLKPDPLAMARWTKAEQRPRLQEEQTQPPRAPLLLCTQAFLLGAHLSGCTKK